MVRGKVAKLVIVTDNTLRPPGAISVGKKDLLTWAAVTCKVAEVGLALVLSCVVVIALAGMSLTLLPGVVGTEFTSTLQV